MRTFHALTRPDPPPPAQGLLELVIHSGVMLAVMAVGCLALPLMIADVTFPAELAMIGAAFVVCSYGIDRLVDARRNGSSQRLALAKCMAWLGPALFVSALGAEALLGTTEALLLLPVFPISVALYTLPCVRLRGAWRCIKQVPHAKAPYVAALWALVPLLAALHTGLPASFALCGFLFGKVWINVSICDVKDMRDDRARGVVSLPVALGFPQVWGALHAANVFAALSTLAMVAAGWLPTFMLFAEIQSILVIVLLCWLAAAPEQRAQTGALLADVSVTLLAPLAWIGELVVSPS